MTAPLRMQFDMCITNYISSNATIIAIPMLAAYSTVALFTLKTSEVSSET